MKKYLFCFAFIFLCTTLQSQNIDQFLKKTEKAENIDKVKISGFLLFLGKMTGGINNMPIAKGIKSMEVYSFSNCKSDIGNEFNDLFYNLKDEKDYETLLYTKDESDAVRILVNKKKDIIHNIVFLCMDDEDRTLIKFTGKIKEKDIAKLMKSKNFK